MSAPRSPARAEVVGSLLRTPRLLEARAGGDPALEEIVDAEVRAAVQRQVDVGLDVVTDGRVRRDAFTHSFYDAIEGIGPSPAPVRFRNGAGDKVLYNGVPRICGRRRKVANPLVRDTDRLRAITERPLKVTLPAASWFVPSAFYEPGVTDRFYDSRRAAGGHAGRPARAHRRGDRRRRALRPARLPQLRPARRRRRARVRDPPPGDRPLRLPRQGARARPPRDRGLPHRRDLRPAHLPRQLPLDVGSTRARSSPSPTGSSTSCPTTSSSSSGTSASARATTRPCATCRPGRSSRWASSRASTRRVETHEQLVREIEQAARHADISQLAISPQCGFASVSEGNELSADDQWRKLEVVARTADEVWGPTG